MQFETISPATEGCVPVESSYFLVSLTGHLSHEVWSPVWVETELGVSVLLAQLPLPRPLARLTRGHAWAIHVSGLLLLRQGLCPGPRPVCKELSVLPEPGALRSINEESYCSGSRKHGSTRSSWADVHIYAIQNLLHVIIIFNNFAITE